MSSRFLVWHASTIETPAKCSLTNCEISLKDNKIGIIGNTENMEEAIQALTSLVQGSKQGNVYSRVEREEKRKRMRDKGFK